MALTMEKMIKEYVGYYEARKYPPASINANRAAVVAFVNYMRDKLGIREPKDISRITFADFEAYRNALLSGYSSLSGRKFSSSTVRNYLQVSNRILKIMAEKYGASCEIIEAKRQKTDTVTRDMQGFPEEFRRYYEEYEKKTEQEERPKNGMKKLRESIRNFYRYLLQQRKLERLSDLKKEDVKDYAPYLTEQTRKNGEKQYQASSINRYTSDLKNFLRWLHKKGVCAPLSESITNIRMEQRLSRNILTRKEIVKLCQVKAETPYEFMAKTVCVMLYASGLRISELLALKKKSVDFDKNELYVYEGKTGKERVVLVGEVGMAYLKLYLEHVRHLVCKGFSDDETVFVSMYEGQKANAEGINHNLKRFCKSAGIHKRISCHCFRHSYGSHLLEAGAKIKQVCDLLGHKDLRTTEQYVRLNPEQLRLTLMKYHPREIDRKGRRE
jgi:integrase/recombinase XerD